MEKKGYIHVYTGDGKGKSTAAFGLALRALCAGKNVYIGQFVKSMKYNETRSQELFNGSHSSFGKLTVEQLGTGCFIDKHPDKGDIDMARSGLERCSRILREGRYDVVILDEINIALHFNLLTAGQVLEALRTRAPQVETVLTGRYAPEEIIAAADLVTEMKEIKHYYRQGVLSRNGIDR